MPVKVTQSGPPLGEADIAAFERKMKVALPRPYRQWLLMHNGGVPQPAKLRYKSESGPYTDGEITFFSSLLDLEADITQFKVWANRLPEDLISIGSDPFGNWICIATHGPNQGKVYFWDHEEEQDEPTYDNCHLIADSFTELLDVLH
jgi:cell wall assembly regulator SMI1